MPVKVTVLKKEEEEEREGRKKGQEQEIGQSGVKVKDFTMAFKSLNDLSYHPLPRHVICQPIFRHCPFVATVPATFTFLLLLECTKQTLALGFRWSYSFYLKCFFFRCLLGYFSSLPSSLCSNITFWVRPTYRCLPIYTTCVNRTLTLPPHTFSIFLTHLYFLYLWHVSPSNILYSSFIVFVIYFLPSPKCPSPNSTVSLKRVGFLLILFTDVTQGPRKVPDP